MVVLVSGEKEKKILVCCVALADLELGDNCECELCALVRGRMEGGGADGKAPKCLRAANKRCAGS